MLKHVMPRFKGHVQIQIQSLVIQCNPTYSEHHTTAHIYIVYQKSLSWGYLTLRHKTIIPMVSTIEGLILSLWLFPSQLHSVVDISVMCVRLCRQICDYLEISCFTIPFPPPNKSDPH